MKKIFLIFGFIVLSVLAPASAQAAGLLEEDCTFCSTNLYCINKENAAGITLKNPQAKDICLPGPSFTPCGSKNAPDGTSFKGDCEKNNESCAVVSSISDPKKFTALCVPANIMVKPDSQPGCNNSSDCNLDEQCVKVSTINFSGSNTLYGVRRCVFKNFLPSTVLDNTGTCGVNAKCTASQVCVKNLFDPEHFPNVCYEKSYIAISPTCTDASSLGKPCGTPQEKNKICMNVQDPNKKYYQCVDATALPGGPNAPSNITCAKDKDCPTEKPFCILNPTTNKNQCFSQDLIFTLMTAPNSGSCTAPGTKGCKDGVSNSTCARYANDPTIILCIKGDALGSGAGKVINKTAEERMVRVAPQLEIDIPTVKFAEELTGTKVDGGTMFNVSYLATYINGVYKYGLGFGVLFATLMLMIAGFRYMTAFGNAKAVGTARDNATNALIGLGLLFSVYTIIYVINPDITKLKAIKITAPTKEDFQMEEAQEEDEDMIPIIPGTGAPKPGVAKKVRFCNTLASCQPLCSGGDVNGDAAKNVIMSSGIQMPEGLVDPREALKQFLPECASGDNPQTRFKNCGIVFRGEDAETKVLPGVVDGLAKAAQVAKQKGYVLSVGSTYRSPLKQIKWTCAHVARGEDPPCGAELACPGGSNHMQGFAIDVCLTKPDAITKCLTAPTGKAASCDTNKEKILADPNLRMLNDIMFTANWFRYCKELWHFEYTSSPADGNRRKTY